MKHPRTPPRRLPAHVQAVIDTLRRIGAEIVETKLCRKVLIIWRIARKVFSLTVSVVVPRHIDAAIHTAKECDRALRVCGAMPARTA